MCQNEPSPESLLPDFRGSLPLRGLGNAANGIFCSSKCWESHFSLNFSLPNVGKGDFRRFFIFPMLGKLIFADFLFSQCWES